MATGGGGRRRSLGKQCEEGTPTRVPYKLLEDFYDIQKIGSGGFGIVVQATKVGEKKATALKLIPFDNRKSFQKTIDEAKRLSTIPPHPAVVGYLGFWEDKFTRKEFERFVELVQPSKNEVLNTFPMNSTFADFLCIQMELCKDGNLRSWLKKRSAMRVVDVDFRVASKIFFQVSKGIEHIHKSGLIHRDLKPGNILLQGTDAKISDLGYSASHTSDDYCHSKNAGACLYQAPEQAYGEYGKGVDYYALGLILFQLFYPPSQKNVGEAITGLKFVGIPVELERTFPKVAELIKSLISYDAKNRPNATEIEQEMRKWPEFTKEFLDSLRKALNCQMLICQGCDKVLTDVRFKCSVCKDYFLCLDCEDIGGIHPVDHDLIKIKTPVSQKPTESKNPLAKNGCKHYSRKCELQCRDCHNFYPCHVCHDEENKGHKLDRGTCAVIRCTECSKAQSEGVRCIACDISFAKYSCVKCLLYDDDENAEKLIFHCDKCGFCRKKLDERFLYDHCDNCSMCYPHMALDPDDGEFISFPPHKCRLGAGLKPCSVCKEKMHESRENAILVDCQHYVHLSCKAKFAPGQTKCADCVDWSEGWDSLRFSD